jgi:hypothetical protein
MSETELNIHKKELLKPKWDDEDANRVLYPDDFDLVTGKELVKPVPFYAKASEKRRLNELAELEGFTTVQGLIRSRIFG